MFGTLGYILDMFEYVRIYPEYILNIFRIYSEELDVLGYIIWEEFEFILRYTLDTFKYQDILDMFG